MSKHHVVRRPNVRGRNLKREEPEEMGIQADGNLKRGESEEGESEERGICGWRGESAGGGSLKRGGI